MGVMNRVADSNIQEKYLGDRKSTEIQVVMYLNEIEKYSAYFRRYIKYLYFINGHHIDIINEKKNCFYQSRFLPALYLTNK